MSDVGTDFEIRFSCPHCQKVVKGKADWAGKKGLCPHCAGTGYFERTGVFELLTVTDRVRELLKGELNLEAIRQEAVRHGMISLYQDGMRQVIEGATSIEELLRVAK